MKRKTKNQNKLKEILQKKKKTGVGYGKGGHGKGAKGFGKGNVRSHHKVLRDNITGVTKPAIC